MNDALIILTSMQWPAAIAIVGIATSIGGAITAGIITRGSKAKAEIAAHRDVDIATARSQTSQLPTVRGIE